MSDTSKRGKGTRKNRGGGNRPPANEIAQAAVEPHWNTLAERRDLGVFLLANTLACGIATTEAVAQVADHPWMRNNETGRGPHLSTVWEWLKQATFEDVDVTIGPDGKVTRTSLKMDIDERRRQYLGRIDSAVIRWTAQAKALAQGLQGARQPLDEKEAIHKAMIRCEKMAQDFMRLGAQLLHIDKIPPLERLDDPEVRQILRSHIERSLAYFTAEERDAWRALFTDQAVAENEAARSLREQLVQ